MFKDLHQEIKSHVLRAYPDEICGVIALKDLEQIYIPLENISKSPKDSFEINLVEYLEIQKESKVIAIVHSHSLENFKQKSCPSKSDMQSQIDTSVIWGVFDTNGVEVSEPYWWGDFILKEDLIGKQFHAGINDCYSIIRKYYFQKYNIKLLDFARSEVWWENGENMYEDNFKKAGFFKIEKEDLKDGDLMLCKLKSKVINHAGIYLDNGEDGRGLILHHLPKRLSRRESAYNWLNRSTLFLRHSSRC